VLDITLILQAPQLPKAATFSHQDTKKTPSEMYLTSHFDHQYTPNEPFIEKSAHILTRYVTDYRKF